LIVFQFSQTYFKNFEGSFICAYFSQASAVVELLAISGFFTKLKAQNISPTTAATWQQNLAADLSQKPFFYFGDIKTLLIGP